MQIADEDREFGMTHDPIFAIRGYYQVRGLSVVSHVPCIKASAFLKNFL